MQKRKKKNWISKTAKEYFKQIFVDNGFQDITSNEALELASQFLGTPTLKQIVQIFRNWAQRAQRVEATRQDLCVAFQPILVSKIFISRIRLYLFFLHKKNYSD